MDKWWKRRGLEFSYLKWFMNNIIADDRFKWRFQLFIYLFCCSLKRNGKLFKVRGWLTETLGLPQKMFSRKFCWPYRVISNCLEEGHDMWSKGQCPANERERERVSDLNIESSIPHCLFSTSITVKMKRKDSDRERDNSFVTRVSSSKCSPDQ